MASETATARALLDTLISPNVADSNMEPANVVDVLQRIADGTKAVANSITPRDVAAGRDSAGGTVDSLTEAVMGVTSGLCRIADSITDLASAIREHSS